MTGCLAGNGPYGCERMIARSQRHDRRGDQASPFSIGNSDWGVLANNSDFAGFSGPLAMALAIGNGWNAGHPGEFAGFLLASQCISPSFRFRGWVFLSRIEDVGFSVKTCLPRGNQAN